MSLSSRTSFVVALVVLAVCAMGLEGATRYLKLHFRKERVELTQPLESIPAKLGPWVQVTPEAVITSDEEHVLGTNKYIMRVYVDTTIVPPEIVETLRDKPSEERNIVLGQIQEKAPHAMMSLMVTYYTGLADTVAHVPDRCYIADGFDVAKADVLHWSKADKDVRYLTFEDTTTRGRVRRNVGYFFSVNGRWVADPIEVRGILGNLFEKYGYYAKIELMTQQVDRDTSAATMDRFLADALPALQQSLPDWNLYKGK